MGNKQKTIERTIQGSLNIARRAQETADTTNDPEERDAMQALADMERENAARNQERLDALLKWKQENGYSI